MSKKKPCIQLEIFEVRNDKTKWWNLFSKYHYLNHSFNKAARVFVCFCNKQLASFCAVLPFPHPHIKNVKKGHRTVVLPDYQGVGIGTVFTDLVAAYFVKQGYSYISTTSNPAMIATRAKSNKWICTRIGRCSTGSGKIQNKNKKGSTSAARITASFKYKG